MGLLRRKKTFLSLLQPPSHQISSNFKKIFVTIRYKLYPIFYKQQNNVTKVATHKKKFAEN